MDNNLNQELEDAKTEQSKKAVKDDAKGLWASLKIFIVELLDFRHDTDREATVAAIKADIPFKGATAWILICSIFVASVGLNANSTSSSYWRDVNFTSYGSHSWNRNVHCYS